MHQFILATPQEMIPGCIQILHDGNSISSLDILTELKAPTIPADQFEKHLLDVFNDYFSGRQSLASLPVQLHGSEFQCRVWRALQDIETGSVMAYGELAKSLHSSARAVGNACRRNPIPLIVPCHRVVAKTGIGGFAGATQGGLIEQKRRLLAHEGISI